MIVTRVYRQLGNHARWKVVFQQCTHQSFSVHKLSGGTDYLAVKAVRVAQPCVGHSRRKNNFFFLVFTDKKIHRMRRRRRFRRNIRRGRFNKRKFDFNKSCSLAKETVRAERRVDFENTFKYYHNQKCQNSECGKHTRNTARKLEYRSPYARTEA